MSWRLLSRILIVCGCIAGVGLIHVGDLARLAGDPIGSRD